MGQENNPLEFGVDGAFQGPGWRHPTETDGVESVRAPGGPTIQLSSLSEGTSRQEHLLPPTGEF